jgi:hypothetical protein
MFLSGSTSGAPVDSTCCRPIDSDARAAPCCAAPRRAAPSPSGSRGVWVGGGGGGGRGLCEDCFVECNDIGEALGELAAGPARCRPRDRVLCVRPLVELRRLHHSAAPELAPHHCPTPIAVQRRPARNILDSSYECG